MRFLLLVLLCALIPSVRADDLTRFVENDRAIGSNAWQDVKDRVNESLEILIKQGQLAKTPKALVQTASKFDRAARKNDDGFATSFSWVDITSATTKQFKVVCAAYGPVGRVVIQDASGQNIALPELQFMDQRHPSVLLLNDDSVVIASTFTRDAGFRENTRLSFIRLGSSPKHIQSMDFEHTLDWGGPRVLEGQIVVFSIDSPKAFFVPNTDPILKHRRVFKVSAGQPQLILDDPQDRALRVLDRWMDEARWVKEPTAMQKVLRKFLPEVEMIDDHRIQEYGDGSVAITMVGSNGEVRFALKPVGKTYKVTKAEGKVR